VRVARYMSGDGTLSYGIVDGAAGAEFVVPIGGSPFGDLSPAGPAISLADARLLAPVTPSKIVGFGRNFAPALRADDEEPSFFLKAPSSIIGPGEFIRLPAAARGGALFEVELAVIIGRRCRDVPARDIASVVLGYTIANDVSGLDLARVPAGNYPVKAKSYDTFCPLGPWIETDIEPGDLAVGCDVNGTSKQTARTSDMITPVSELVAIASEVMTLLPGDVILTGTPPGLEPLRDGDHVEAWIDGIGRLANTVVGSSAGRGAVQIADSAA
jgi:2-keto-4-pentenoate hydratase/2-oxohepta-3-ene-1,7-dioic acid hydratase in catechol pathway